MAIKEKINPFEYDTPLTIYESFKLFFMTVTLILPLRIFLFLVSFVVATIICFVATIGVYEPANKESKPLMSWRKRILSLVPYCARVLLLLLGFWKINTKGVRSKTASFIVPNHTGFVDVFLLYYLYEGCTAVSKSETFDLPLIGFIFKALQIIPVKRESPESRASTKHIMKNYIHSHSKSKEVERFPQILIFPEGTTHRHNHVLMFQKGAFLFGAPVQPVAISFEYKNFNPAWVVSKTWDLYFLRCFAQFNQNVTVEYLPVHFPTKEEKQNPALYANNVRYKIAKALNANITDHWYEDVKLYSEAVKLKEKLDKNKINHEVEKYIEAKNKEDEKLIEKIPKLEEKAKKLIKIKNKVQGKVYYFRRLVNYFFFAEESKVSTTVDLTNFEMKQLKSIYQDKQCHLSEIVFLLRKFVEVDEIGNGYINFDDFCSVLGIEKNLAQSRNLFSFFDNQQAGKLEFKDLALGLAYCSSNVNSEQKRKLAFALFDVNGNGYISFEQFRRILILGNSSPEQNKINVQEIENKLLKFMDESQPTSEAEEGVSWEMFDKFSKYEPKLVDHVLNTNYTGWSWNLKTTMKQINEKKQV